jgi:hypothetical protein
MAKKTKAQVIRDILRKPPIPPPLPIPHCNLDLTSTGKYRSLYPDRYDPSVIVSRRKHGWDCWVEYDDGMEDHYAGQMNSKWYALSDTLQTVSEDLQCNAPRHDRHCGVDDLADELDNWSF